MIPSNPRTKESRKLVIKNLKAIDSSDKRDTEYIDASWRLLLEAIDAVYTSRPIQNLEDLYRRSEDLCDMKRAPEMYNKLRDLCRRHTLARIEELRVDASSGSNTQFLLRADAAWTQYCDQLRLLRSIFLVLDRTYALREPQVQTIWDMGLQMFGKFLVEASLERRVVDAILELIDCERAGQAVDSTLLRSMCLMLIYLRLYDTHFEEHFLERARRCYEAESRRMIEAPPDVGTYIHYCQKRLREEELRLTTYLSSSTQKKIIGIVDSLLLERHLDEVLRGVDKLIDDERVEDCRMLYRQTRRVQPKGPGKLRVAWSAYIKSRGALIVQAGVGADNASSGDRTMVQDLLDFKAKMDRILEECLDGDRLFRQEQKDAFEYFINQRPNKPAEMIAKYVDGKLRQGNKEASEEELERIMDRLLILFRFVHGKDVFEAYYKKDLAKRLLLQKSASVDAEKTMLLKLKAECGATFTNKLEGMFKDIELSKDIMATYREHHQHRIAASAVGIDHSVSVLTTGTWPSYQASKIRPAKEMVECRTQFENFYLKKHSGRKLTWVPSLGHCHVEAHFRGGRKLLQVSEHQCLVMLLFNDVDDDGDDNQLTFQAIQEQTQMEPDELKCTLQSLSCGKVRVLTRVETSGNKREIGAADCFRFNDEFQNKFFRVKINQVQMRETAEEHSVTEQRIAIDRQYMIDAAIVRIMKARKSMLYQALVSEVFQQVRFKMTATDVKRRIDSLIERDYMARDRDDQTSYHYVA